MRDKAFHALCAAHALEALIAKNNRKGVTTYDDEIFSLIAVGAIAYADRMVEVRRRRYSLPYRIMADWFLWIDSFSLKQTDRRTPEVE
jgi:hypothetical protein